MKIRLKGIESRKYLEKVLIEVSKIQGVSRVEACIDEYCIEITGDPNIDRDTIQALVDEIGRDMIRIL